MKLVGIKSLTVAELESLVSQGGKFVVYQYCISVLVLSFKRGSEIYFIPPGQSAFWRGLPYTLISLTCGWWGIPWGPIWTVTTLARNVSGGKDITAEIMAIVRDQSDSSMLAGAEA